MSQNIPPLHPEEGQKAFGKEIYENLPDLLKEPCDQLIEESDKGVFLTGALGVVSGMLPNVQGHYFGDEVRPNLYCFVLGRYGTGKGALKYARALGEPMHKQLQEQEKKAVKSYGKEMQKYRKQLAEYQKGTVQGEAPEEPVAPVTQKLFIPANSSNAAMKLILNESGGRGILFETEGDTLANTLKHEYGNYSDDLRKAFHHEPISYFRKTNREDVEISSPCLSVVLSSTFDQLLRLIPNVENGLFSRFCYFEIEGDPRFKNPFDKQKNGYTQYFAGLGERYLAVYNKLFALKETLWLELTEQQEETFWILFQQWKNEMREHISEDLDGTVNRLGIICFRICMVLSVLRVVERNMLPDRITCTEQDFNNAVRIVDVFRSHAVEVFLRLPQSNTSQGSLLEKEERKVERIKRCLELHSKGLSLSQIAIQVFGKETYKSKVKRILDKHDQGLIE